MGNIKWNPFSQSFRENPHVYYGFFKEKQPIHRGIGNQWFVSRNEDVKGVLKNTAFLTDAIGSNVFSKSKFIQETGDFNSIAQNSDFWFNFMNENLHKELQGGVVKHWNDINLKNLVEEYIEIVLQNLEPNEEIDFTKTIIETISSYLNCKLFGLTFEDKTCLFGCLSHSNKNNEPFNNLHALNNQNDEIISFQNYLTKIVAEKNRTHNMI